MNQPDTPPTSGLIAGKYELVAMIGRGGMGSVWEARHASLGTRFAIKFIEAEYADSQEARSRFDKEARAAATIQSKHAIQIYDHGLTGDGKPYIVMELLQGEPLDKRLDRLGRLALPDTARILQQVCRGLQRAHERGIVHRDLKPENIFLVRSPDDDDEIAKVLDFGIAKVSGVGGQPMGVTSSTKTGAVLGTPFYMSPEQARGLRNVDHRTDLWSLGVIAFKCVVGHLPFDGESVGDLLVKICTAPIPVPSHVLPGLPPSFDAWFARALEREPDRRFASATELADALGYAAGLAPRGAASSQHGAPLAALGTVAPSGQPAQSPYGPAPTPAPAAMTAAPFTSSQRVPGVPSGRGKLVAIAAVGLVAVAAGAAAALWTMRPKPVVAHEGLVAPPSAAASLPAPASAAVEPPVADSAAAVASVLPIVPAKAPSKTGSKPPKSTAADKPPLPPTHDGPAASAKPTATAVTPLPKPTATATATTPKKNNDDPGY